MKTEISDNRSAAGACFYKCALQVNPHHYGSTFRGRESGADALEHARKTVEKAAELGIKVLAVTDHNSVSSIHDFQSAARECGIHVLPGFEIASSEGVHVLCLYPPDARIDQLSRYLGEFGIRETKPSATPSDKPFETVLDIVESQGGITIAAHVTGSGGLFKVLRGQPRVRAWRHRNLIAAQIPGSVENLPQGIHDIIKNRNAEYRRSHAPDPALAISVVNAKDIVEPGDLEDRSATCWIKMDEVGIGGLRQAFLDPGSRIRLNPEEGEFEPEPHMELSFLEWKGGFLDGVGIHLNSNLNVLIGGRGTGKSTIIESIRAVLGLMPIGADARKAHEGVVRHVLRSGTKISLRVRVPRPALREYRIERTIPNPPIVRDARGAVLRLEPADILPGIEAYGQHEISELARSPDKLTRLLDRFVEADASISRRKNSLRSELEKNRQALSRVSAGIAQAEERLDALPGLQETLARFQEAGLEDRLKEQSLMVREEQVLDSIPQRLDPFQEALELLRKELPIDLTFLSERAIAELPSREILSRLNPVLAQFGEQVERMAGDLMQALEQANRAVDRVRDGWDVRKREVRDAYEQILRELQKSRVDGEQFMRLRREIEGLKPLQDRLGILRRLERERSDERRALLAEWEDIKAGEVRALDRAAKTVSCKLRGRVRVEVSGAGDREPLFKLLREEIGGRMSEAIESLRESPELSLARFAQACRAGAESLRTEYRMTAAQAERLAAGEPEVFMRIEELELPPATDIRLNTAPAQAAAAWRPLEELSAGQKATAVLLLLLLESNAPLIVDQPEDDLDNRFITEGIVPRMRDEKQRRQFIFSTHNANVPVLGDAELILGLSADGEADGGKARIAPEHRGSIDFPTVRDLVEDILEGGRDAFEMRRLKYGF